MSSFDRHSPEPVSLYEAARRRLERAEGRWQPKEKTSEKSANLCTAQGDCLANFYNARYAEIDALATAWAGALVALVDATRGDLEQLHRVVENIELPRQRFGGRDD